MLKATWSIGLGIEVHLVGAESFSSMLVSIVYIDTDSLQHYGGLLVGHICYHLMQKQALTKLIVITFGGHGQKKSVICMLDGI